MSTDQIQDLRSNAKEHARVKAHKAKWSRGSHAPSGVTCWHAGRLPLVNEWNEEECATCSKRPQVRTVTANYTAWRRAHYAKKTAQNNSMSKKVNNDTFAEAVVDAHDDLSDSSGDVEINEASSAPELNEVMFSYDAPTGPNQGSDVLSYAITQAVQRYENNETDKIVKREYDLLLDAEDEPASYVADADDDFELIDVSHLK